jgi:osmotically inducible protein OsmC
MKTETNKIVHVAEVLAEGGRDGRVLTDSGAFDLPLTTAPQPNAITPEHLFAGAYAACFLGALRNAAAQSHLSLGGVTVVAQVSLIENEQEDYELRVLLRASIPGVDLHRAQHLMHLAHRTSPYSKAIRGNVDVLLETD